MKIIAKFTLQMAGVIACLITLLFATSLSAARSGPVVVPENGYATGSDYGSGWRCKHSFIEKNDACEAVVVPENGHLAERGVNSKCNRSYRADGDSCVLIQVPANGYLTSSARKGWQCERGFKMVRDECLTIVLPPNAYLTNAQFGDEWECERGYKEANGNCEKIQVPTNAFLVDLSYGPGWKCERGYAPDASSSCLKLIVPENAHLKRDGNDWKCNRPYSRRGDACVKSIN